MFRFLMRAGLAAALPLAAFATARAESPAVACPADPIPCCDFDAAAARPIGPLRLGFQIWPLHLPSMVEQASALSPRIVRFSVGPYWRDLPALPTDADLDGVRAYVWQALAKDEAAWRAAAAAQHRLEVPGGGPAVERLLIIWEPPLSDIDGPELRVHGSKREARPEAITLNARFYIALIEGARRLGFRVDSVEIANEPDGAWNMHIPPDIYLDLLFALRREAANAGVTLPRLAGPGLAFFGSLRQFFSDTLLAKRILGEVDIVSAHAWDDRLGHDIIAEAKDARGLLDALGWRDPIMISEFAPTYPLEEDRTLKRGPDQREGNAGGAPLVSDLRRYAPSTTELALALAAAGFNPLVYWEFMDPPWGTVSYGLLQATGKPRPALRGLARPRSN